MGKKKYNFSFVSFLLPVAVFLTLIIFLLFLVGVFNLPEKEARENDPPDEFEPVATEGRPVIPCDVRRNLDGVCATAVEDFVYGVMIDNHNAARPQAGLSESPLVFETVAEAPITRFLAIYSDDLDVPAIGPVRSARPYYLDWAKEFSAPYVHVGGSPDAIELLKNYDYNLDEYFNGKYFWRDNSRVIPHQVLTSSGLLKKAFIAKGWELAADYSAWRFKSESSEAERGAVSDIEINFGSIDGLVFWRYNKATNDYERYQGGTPHLAAGPIVVKNVVVMYTESKVLDNAGRRDTKTLGGGEALVFQDGNVIKGEWQKMDNSARTRIFIKDGEDVQFNPGHTWVEVVPNNYQKVKYLENGG